MGFKWEMTGPERGYARVRGCSMLMTTYAVGELSALNGVLGA